MYPKPDRSNQTPNFIKSAENEALDLAWNEGNLSDGRSYRIECWAEDQITMLTFFFSTSGIEKYTESMLKELLVEEKLVQFVKKDATVSGFHYIDASGNKMWSVNVCIGTEDELFANGLLNLHTYT
ncbi:MAG: hypothetical protein HOI47_24510 [Candidatus Scalindua sp.]|nr:hypothetical protein [Candidatus Neomarinimicrobiota bacterium]MBT6229817.1 hypothetical protein [Candidatus Scalindua sp.]